MIAAVQTDKNPPSHQNSISKQNSFTKPERKPPPVYVTLPSISALEVGQTMVNHEL